MVSPNLYTLLRERERKKRETELSKWRKDAAEICLCMLFKKQCRSQDSYLFMLQVVDLGTFLKEQVMDLTRQEKAVKYSAVMAYLS